MVKFTKSLQVVTAKDKDGGVSIKFVERVGLKKSRKITKNHVLDIAKFKSI